jgi:Ca2+-transporting ATPase
VNLGSRDDSPWALETENVLKSHGVQRDRGLDPATVQDRLRTFGSNKLKEIEKVSSLRRFANQFLNPIVVTLLAATLISFFLGEYVDALAIFVIILVNAFVGYLQESKAEAAVDELSRLSAPRAKVLRSGQIHEIPSDQVCPGDILSLEAGDYVPADARLIEARQLSSDEAALTGESLSVAKSIEVLPHETLLADRRNMIFAGTAIVNGTGRAVVTATGMQSEIGKIAGLLETVKTELTPLQGRLKQVSHQLLILCSIIVVLVAGLSLVQGQELFEVMLSAVSLAVAAIPEGLPAVVTIALALAIRRMARRRAIVRHLPAVETLGSTSVICTDKTGTLTTGRMEVRELHTLQTGLINVDNPKSKLSEDGQRLLHVAAICSNAILQADGEGVGDTTEIAILKAANKFQPRVDKTSKDSSRLYEWSFDSVRKRMSVAIMTESAPMLHVKGAPESVLPLCFMPSNVRDDLEVALEKFSSQGRRVLAVATRVLDRNEIPVREPGTEVEARQAAELVERELMFLGFISMADPPRPEAIQAIGDCHNAGIKVVMITGDHPQTAHAVACELGISHAGKNDVLTGLELSRMTQAELDQKVEDITVYARVSPEDKLRIVKAWKTRGHVVAMTGDGVNDAPALRQANIGVAMGKGGTEVARQAASMILTDDNFATLSAAIEEGRAVFGNIRRTVLYLLTGNFTEILIMLGAVILGWPAPLMPIHLLWINLVTDGLPSLALASEPVPKDTMQTGVRPSPASFFNRDFYTRIFWVVLISAGLALGVYGYSLKTEGLEIARSEIFTFLVFEELFRSFACRHENRTFFQMGWRSNIFLLLAVFIPIGFQLTLHHTEFFRDIFQVTPISWRDCIAMLILPLIPVTILEVRKIIKQRRVG